MIEALLARSQVLADVDDAIADRRAVGDGARHAEVDRLVDAEEVREPGRDQRAQRDVEMGHADRDRLVRRGSEARRGGSVEQTRGSPRVIDRDHRSARGQRPAVRQAHGVHTTVVLDGLRGAAGHDLTAAAADHRGKAVDEARPAVVEVQHAMGGRRPQLRRRRTGVEQ